MNARGQRLCVWCGVLLVLVLGAGILIAGLAVPLSPTKNADQVAAFYRTHAGSIKVGCVFALFGIVFFTPWWVGISMQLKRVEGPFAALTWTQLLLGILIPMETILALSFFATAAFRADRPASEIQLLSDLGWLPWVGLVYTAVIQNIFTGIIILWDKRPVPVFPKWSGWLTIVVGLVWAPGGLDYLAKTGPLAWNGLNWYVTLVAFFVWIPIMTVLTFRAIDSHELEWEAEQVGGSPGHRVASTGIPASATS